MAGIWDRLAGNAAEDFIPVHLLTAVLHLRDEGVLADNDAVYAALNAQLSTPLSPAAESDVDNLITQVAGLLQLDTASWLHRVESLGLIIASVGGISESTWRTQVGLV